MAKRPNIRHRKNISLMFSVLTFLTLTITLLLTAGLVMLMINMGLFVERSRAVVLIVIAIVSIIVGTVLSKIAGRHPIKTIVSMSEAAKEVAKGNFDVRLDEEIQIEELLDMAQNFNIMVRELAGTEILRNDFVENVSHEFKTPLSAIEGYTTLLQKPGLSDEKRAEYTQKILYNTKRLSSLSSNMLLLSRLENHEIGIQKETFCLDEQIREIILSLEDEWTQKKIELEVDLDNTDYSGSRDLLVHVWQNILSNAVKFVNENGMIRILLRKERECIKVHIADNGAGMSEDVRKRVFEKFYQGDRSHSSKGNGLGLALAKRIVDLHGGEISVSSIIGKGTTFTVLLPT